MKIVDILISAGYTISPAPTEGDYNFSITAPMGEKIIINGEWDCPIFAPCDNGNKIVFTRRQIVNEMYAPSEDDWFINRYGYSLRTKWYLDKLRKKICLVEYSVNSDYLLIFNSSTKIISIDFVDTKKDVTTLTQTDNKYVVQMPVWDDNTLTVHTSVFEEKPTRFNMQMAYKLYDVEHKLSTHKLSETFSCCECEKKIHWLDTTGDFRTRLGNLEDKHCGCRKKLYYGI